MACKQQRVAVLGRKVNKGQLCDRKPRAQPENIDHTPLPEVRLLPIASIRTNGDTQHRNAPNPNIVREYAELMRAGVVFPPVAVFWDGKDHWLSDGFQRIDAAKLASAIRNTIGMVGLRARAPSAISRFRVSTLVKATRPCA